MHAIALGPSSRIHWGEPTRSQTPAQEDLWHQQRFENWPDRPQLPAPHPRHRQRPREDGRGHGASRRLAESGADRPLREDDHEEEDELGVYAAVVGGSGVSSTREDSPGQERQKNKA